MGTKSTSPVPGMVKQEDVIKQLLGLDASTTGMLHYSCKAVNDTYTCANSSEASHCIASALDIYVCTLALETSESISNL